MAKKIRRMLSLVVALCICVSVLPLQALAVEETTTETTTEVSPEGLNTEITTTTTTETDEEGKTTVTVTIAKETDGTTTDGVNVKREESTTSTTITESNGAVTEQTTSEGSEKKEWTEEIKPGEEVPDVVAKWEPDTEEPIKGEVSESIAEGEIESENGKITTTVDRTVNVEISDVEVKVEEPESGLVKEQDTALKGFDPVYDENDDLHMNTNGQPLDKVNGQHVGKDGLFDRNFLSSQTFDYVNVNGVSIWIDKGEKKIVDIVTPEGAELPDHELLNGIAVGSDVASWYPTSNSFKKALFPSGTQYKGGVKINDINNWYNADDELLVSIPDGGEFMYVGTGEHSKYFVGLVKVIYKKDENGKVLYDEDGNPVIEKLVNNVNGTDHTSNGELLDEIVPEYAVDAGFSSSRAQNFMLMDKDGNRVYVYCSDVQTGAVKGKWYSVSNLEDSEYYTPEAENHIRNIALNGYWGTSDVQKEDGSYELGSLEGIKAKLIKAVNDGEIERYVQVPVRDTSTAGAGKIQVDEDGNPIYHDEKMDLLEIISGMTEGEAMLATQAAIWSFANGSQGAVSGIDGPVVISPDWYRNHQLDYSKHETEPLDDAAGVRVSALYTWLMSLDTEEESTVVINDKNFVENMSIVVHEKDAEHTNNQDDDQDNDVYNTDLNFKLAFIPGDKDDLLVQITYNDLDGNPVNLIRRLAGKNAEGQNYEDIKPEADGSYVLKGLKLSENENFAFDLRLEGTQYLENGVYLYTPIGGRDVSQTFVGVAQGERNVDVTMGVTVSFDVDEEKNVVAERVWYNEGDPTYTPGEDPEDPEEPTVPEDPEEPTVPEQPEDDGTTTIPENRIPYAPAPAEVRLINDDETVTIEEEEVPLAATPETGDMTALWIVMIVVAGVGLCAYNVYFKKQQKVF